MAYTRRIRIRKLRRLRDKFRIALIRLNIPSRPTVLPLHQRTRRDVAVLIMRPSQVLTRIMHDGVYVVGESGELFVLPVAIPTHMLREVSWCEPVEVVGAAL
jgi:hypothetical protein